MLVIFTTKIVNAFGKSLSIVIHLFIYVNQSTNYINLDITVGQHRLPRPRDLYIVIYGNKRNIYRHCLEVNQKIKNQAMEKEVNRRQALDNQMMANQVMENQTKIQIMVRPLRGNRMVINLKKN